MVLITSGSAVSVAANTKSADQVSGTYQFAPFNGYSLLIAKASATGMNCTYVVNGQTIINDQPIGFTGTAGTISIKDNVLGSAPVAGGMRQELTFRNTTGGSLTVDYQLLLDPAGK